MSRNFFQVGPLSEVEERIEDFTSKLYLQKLYNETVAELVETQVAYDTAIEQHNDELVKTLKSQLDFLESVVVLANNNFSSYSSDIIYYD